VRLAEREIPRERAGGPDPDVRDIRLEPRERRERLRHGRVALELPVGDGRADPNQIRRRGDPAERGDRLDVDEVRPVGDAQLHGEEELRPARIDGGVIPIPLAKGDRLGHRSRFMDVEAAQDQAEAPRFVLRGDCIRYTVDSKVSRFDRAQLPAAAREELLEDLVPFFRMAPAPSVATRPVIS